VYTMSVSSRASPASYPPSKRLANAIFEYLEIFHNRKRRHSALGMRTPVGYEMMMSPYPTQVA
jgi:transposase InsO family protein